MRPSHSLRYDPRDPQPTIIVDFSIIEEPHAVSATPPEHVVRWRVWFATVGALGLGFWFSADSLTHGGPSPSVSHAAAILEGPLTPERRGPLPSVPAAVTAEGLVPEPTALDGAPPPAPGGSAVEPNLGVDAPGNARRVPGTEVQVAAAEPESSGPIQELGGGFPAPARAGLGRQSTAPRGPKGADVHGALLEAQASLSRGDRESARAAYLRAVPFRRGQVPGFLGLARLALAERRLEEALDMARKAVMRGPFVPECRLVLGDALRAAGEISEAEAEYERASLLARKPFDRAAHLPPNPF